MMCSRISFNGRSSFISLKKNASMYKAQVIKKVHIDKSEMILESKKFSKYKKRSIIV